MVSTAVSHAMYYPLHVMHVKDAYYVDEAASGRIKVNPAFWFAYHVNICLAISAR